MKVHKNAIWIGRLISVLWGFTSVILFRYSLNKIFPFLSTNFSLSFFAFLLIVIIFLSFAWHFHHHHRKQKKGIWFSIIIFLNSVIFIGMVMYFSEEQYLFFFPLAFTFQILLHFFLFCAKLPFFIPYRLALIAGIVPAIFPLNILLSPWIIFPLSSILALFPNRYLHSIKIHFAGNKIRMRPIRESLDLARFLFLGFTILGIFDKFREHFHGVILILIVAAFLQFLIIRSYKKKHHIKFGLPVLAFIFIFLGGIFNLLTFSYWCATGYALLAIWEAVYFKKGVEGYLRREKIIISIVFAMLFLAFLITYEWSVLLLGVVVGLIQLRILIYVLKKFRPLIASLFTISLCLWGIWIFTRYQNSFKRQFWQLKSSHSNRVEPLPTSWLTKINTEKTTYTNVFPEKFYRTVDNKILTSIHLIPFRPITLTSFLVSKKNKKSQFLINLDKLPPYNSEIGTSLLKLFLSLNDIENVILIKTGFSSLSQNRTQKPQILLGQNLLSKNTPEVNNNILDFGLKLSKYWKSNNKYWKSYKNDLELIQLFPDNANLYLHASNIAGILNSTSAQVQLLEKYFKTCKQCNKDIENLLLKLYYYSSTKDKGEKLAIKLANKYSTEKFKYLDWLFKFYQKSESFTAWKYLYKKIKFIKINKSSQKTEKQIRKELLNKIKRQIEINPNFLTRQEEIYKRTKTLKFPE